MNLMSFHLSSIRSVNDGNYLLAKSKCYELIDEHKEKYKMQCQIILYNIDTHVNVRDITNRYFW